MWKGEVNEKTVAIKKLLVNVSQLQKLKEVRCLSVATHDNG